MDWLYTASSQHNRGSLFGFGFFMGGVSATMAPTILAGSTIIMVWYSPTD